jgi:nucleoid-associated protein YgaU
MGKGGETDDERRAREAKEAASTARVTAKTNAETAQAQALAIINQRDAAAAGSAIYVNFNQSMQKAQIYKWANSWIPVVTCKFNPSQLVIDKGVKYTPADAANKNAPDLTFGGGQAATLNLDLFFDTTDSGGDVQSAYTFRLAELMLLTGTANLMAKITASEEDMKKDEIKKQVEAANTAIDAANAALIAQNAPPKVKFVWGRILSFEAYLTKFSQTLTLFKSDGTPVRATVKITLQQSRDEGVFPAQNPTSLSAARKMWVVNAGETLDWIAYKEYGSAAHWRHIAEVNNLADPKNLRSGQILKLTPLPKP